VRATRRLITSIDDFDDLVITAQMRPMVLPTDTVRAELISAQLPNVILTMGDLSFSVVTRGTSLADRIAFATFRTDMSSATMNGERISRGVAHVFGSSTDVVATAGPGQFATISFEPADLERTASESGLHVELPRPGESTTMRIDEPRLLELLSAVAESVRKSDRPAADNADARCISRSLLEIAVRSLAGDAGPASVTARAHSNSVRIVRACELYAAQMNYQNVTLADLCRVADASERRVRRAFYECYNMSPTAFLRIAALNEVRHALLDGHPARDAVSRSASEFGFWHLSRFAGQYRALFGEMPSATVGRESQSRAEGTGA
jgi:AraC family ethanolamine operon transcriptional activator